MKKIILFFALYITSYTYLFSQATFLKQVDDHVYSRFLSNSIGDIFINKNIIWISGAKGISKSTDNGKTWINYLNKEFIYPTIVSMDVKGDTIWTALVYSKNGVTTGGGFTYSTDQGLTWNHIDQVKDNKSDTILYYGNNKLKALPVIVDEQNVTYGSMIQDNVLWISSWSSGIRKSIDLGKTFKRIILPPDNLFSISPNDTLNFQVNPVQNLNHLGFAVYAVDSLEVWAGTAGGVNLSTDGGISWKKFSSQSINSPILGDWVIHINQQKLRSKNRIWITCWKTDDKKKDNYGVCFTENKGQTWNSLLKGVKANYISFKDSVIYIGTDNGILRSDNDGKSFELFSEIFDNEKNYKVLNPQILSIAPKNDTIWIGTSDGLAYTIDNSFKRFGTEWHIQRAYQSVKNNETYAYPNPFSPDDESARIHYKIVSSSAKVSIDIFDFAMNHIRNIVNGVTRSGNDDKEEIWDGRDKNNSKVPNGVYFYRIKLDNDYIWGKILVLE